MILLRYYDYDNDKKSPNKPIEISVKDVETYITDKNREALADFIHDRFYYRYIKPFECPYKNDKDCKHYFKYYKNGFSVMANCCLLIESLETFKQGWKNSNDKGKDAFVYFFTDDKNFIEFSSADIPRSFYKHIRCGILHQGETTGGWKITRQGNQLLDISDKKIDATKFMERLKTSICDYKEELKNSEWEDEIWKNAIIKIKSIIASSKVS